MTENKLYIVVFWFKRSDEKHYNNSYVTISAKDTDQAKERFLDHCKVWEIPLSDYTIYEAKYVYSECV